jgi:hypothetical protein
MLAVTLHKSLACTYIFKNELFPTVVVKQRQHVDAVECRTFFSGLINTFVFDIL